MLATLTPQKSTADQVGSGPVVKRKILLTFKSNSAPSLLKSALKSAPSPKTPKNTSTPEFRKRTLNQDDFDDEEDDNDKDWSCSGDDSDDDDDDVLTKKTKSHQKLFHETPDEMLTIASRFFIEPQGGVSTSEISDEDAFGHLRGYHSDTIKSYLTNVIESGINFQMMKQTDATSFWNSSFDKKIPRECVSPELAEKRQVHMEIMPMMRSKLEMRYFIDIGCTRVSVVKEKRVLKNVEIRSLFDSRKSAKNKQNWSKILKAELCCFKIADRMMTVAEYAFLMKK